MALQNRRRVVSWSIHSLGERRYHNALPRWHNREWAEFSKNHFPLPAFQVRWTAEPITNGHWWTESTVVDAKPSRTSFRVRSWF
jgi:hypothetical protein